MTRIHARATILLATVSALAMVFLSPAGALAFEIVPAPLVTRDDPPRQKMILKMDNGSGPVARWRVRVMCEDKEIARADLGVVEKGPQTRELLLPEPKETLQTRWIIETTEGERISQEEFEWQRPRHWTLYVLKSAHIDIGLHQAQFMQRKETVDNIDKAMELADETAGWPEASRFRYVVEGQWWWRNYPADRAPETVDRVLKDYVGQGIIGVGGSHSGNHTQEFGTEELCRSAYYLREARDRWGLAADTMMMVDNNGISWPIATAYAQAGIRNIVFLPNSGLKAGTDVGWKAKVPHVFYWQGPDAASRILVWSGPHYTSTGRSFGVRTCQNRAKEISTAESAEPQMVKQLRLLEERYPYDVWLVSNYMDNEKPNLHFPRLAREWNARWRWPELRTTGDLSVPFDVLRQRFGDKIPTLRGDMNCGWAHHPLSTPTYLARKRAADRLLPTAEKLATLARLVDPAYVYPLSSFHAAWDALICSDEHGYGVSAYEGKNVYCTWMNKRYWIDRGLATARRETGRALRTLAAHVPTEGPTLVVFNPLLRRRTDTVEVELPEGLNASAWVPCSDSGEILPATAEAGRLRFVANDVPPLGYKTFTLRPGRTPVASRAAVAKAPVVENGFYRVAFAADGSVESIFDKQLRRELLDPKAAYRGNQFVYTRDDHKTFATPATASFEVETSNLATSVVARTREPSSGAALVQRVTLPKGEKRIDFDNRLEHVLDLHNEQRSEKRRYGYYAFPFSLPDATFRVQLNGCTARPHDDQVGTGTEDWMAAQDYVDVSNDEFGVTWAQRESHLVECGRIRTRQLTRDDPPKTAHLYSYLFNDWYQKNWTSPREITMRYRYSITSRAADGAADRPHWFARRFANPLVATTIAAKQSGDLAARRRSFLSTTAANVELLTLKLSETPGRGVIARMHEISGQTTDAVTVGFDLAAKGRWTQCNVAERDVAALKGPEFAVRPFDFATLRIEAGAVPETAPQVVVTPVDDKSVALAWKPIAGAARYYVFRGSRADFRADADGLIATTTECRHVDTWLNRDTAYAYRVLGVGAGNVGMAVSASVVGRTKPDCGSPPAPVGYHDRGLIAAPCAWRGDAPDALYLLWGQNRETDVSHYELYRGQAVDFTPSPETLVAPVPPGPFVVVSYDDTGLEPYTTYYYRVRAVDDGGHKGPMSEPWSGTTREPIPSSAQGRRS